MTSFITVQLVYAHAGQVWKETVTAAAGCTLYQVVQASGFLSAFPQFRQALPPVGVFGRVRALDDHVHDGDRIEIYRPLVFDPMESRRRRARHKAAGIVVNKTEQKTQKQ